RTDYWHPVMQDKNCFEVMNELQKNLLDQIKSGDSVLLSSGSLVSELVFAHKLDGFQYDLKNRNGDVLESAAAIKLHFENLGNFASTLAQAGARLYLYLPGPHFGGGPVEFDVACTSNLYWLKKATGVASDRNECRISKSKVATEQRAPLDEHLILLKSKFPEIEILDALEGDACAGETCNAAWYSDAHRMHYWSAADFLLKHFETRRNESK
ncbi:hypothetical protein EBR21_03165, partial [bacterium]|nr:hypothetical protein [bacterium]